ncbi:MAG: AI-2E family transporter [Thermodesulfovibrionales bacterium]
MNEKSSAPRTVAIASWLIAGTALLAVLSLHLLPALIAGCLVYELVHVLAPLLRITRLSDTRAKLVVVSLLAFLIALLLVLGMWGLMAFLNSETTGISGLLQKMAEIIERSRETLPAWLGDYLPPDADTAREGAVHWLRVHAGELELIGKEAGRIAAYILAGMVIGAMVSLRDVAPAHESRPLAKALTERTTRLGQAFRAIVFAQVRIAALNTVFAWVYLEVVLPLSGVHLPLRKTMIAVTFATGLLPVVGNLVSNTVITVVSLSHSLSTAAASLVFLIVVHKLEYFLNARIVGTQIRSSAWEVLIAMLLMESAFGIAGVIAAPIYYAYLKRELMDQRLV